jgi:hypothetical protein
VICIRLDEGNGMCNKCTELDTKIDRYKRLASSIADGPTIDGIKALIEKMKAQKFALHPDQK